MAGVGLTVDVVRMGYEAVRRRGSWLVCLLCSEGFLELEREGGEAGSSSTRQ